MFQFLSYILSYNLYLFLIISHSDRDMVEINDLADANSKFLFLHLTHLVWFSFDCQCERFYYNVKINGSLIKLWITEIFFLNILFLYLQVGYFITYVQPI